MPRFFGERLGRARRILIRACLLAVALWAEPAFSQGRCERFYRSLRLPPLITQQTEYTCGAACVVSLVKQLLGRQLKESHVAAVIGTNRSVGTTPEKMAKGLARFGLKAKVRSGLKLRELESNFRRGRGQILLVQSGDSAHWVVLAGYSDGKITVMDPWRDYTDYVTYTEEELLSVWETSLMGKKKSGMALIAE